MPLLGGSIIRCGLLGMILVSYGPLEGTSIFLFKTFPSGHVFMRR
jgi:hypothetical protein